MLRAKLFLNTRNNFVARRAFVFLVVITALICSNGLVRGAASGNLKYAHHGPLVSALSGRSVHDGGGNSNSVNAVASGTTDSLDSTANGNNGGGGEILVPKTFPMSPQEPTCEQLRAMWIFSKRQSRAAEITNEIPTYRDPFAYNVWEPYYSTTRSLGAVRMVPRYGERSRSPVFGRVVSREPLIPQRINLGLGQRQRHFGAETKALSPSANGRRTTQYRYVGSNSGSMNNGGGGGGAGSNGPPNSVAVQGSFQKLKELIWTERAKELTQQRRAEEMAARAAVLKEIANGQNIQPAYKPSYKAEAHLMDENRSPDREGFDHMNDDHRATSIASGQSQTLGGASQNSKAQNRMKSVGTPRSYANRAQKSSSIFSGNTGRSGRTILPSMLASSYSIDDSSREQSGIAKVYPERQSHFRERNRSLFKQHTPRDYFQRDARRKAAYEVESDIPNNLMFNRLINDLNRRILEKQAAFRSYNSNEETSPTDDSDLLSSIQALENTSTGHHASLLNYDDEQPMSAVVDIEQYTEPQEQQLYDYY